MATIREVCRVDDLDGLLLRMARRDENPRVIAGGTDLLLKCRGSNESLTLIDVTGVTDLSVMEECSDGIRIGAAVRLADLVRSDVVRSRWRVLADGAAVIAGPPIRNLATLGGNVCNASPSADTVPPLLVLDARAELRSANGMRSVPVAELFVGPGRTVLGPDEVAVAFTLPWPEPGTVASYTKVSPRQAMDLAVAGVAVSLSRAGGELMTRIGLGAVAPTPLRAFAAEEYVQSVGEIHNGVAAEAGRLAEEAVSPIDDVRGSARYRRQMVRRLVARDLLRGFDRLAGQAVSS